MIKATIFDLDDTLFDSTELSSQARRNAIRAMIGVGLPASFDEAHQVLSEVVKDYGSNYSFHFDQMLKRLSVESSKMKFFVSAGMIGYHDVKYANIRPFTDVVPTFLELKKLEVKICILSDGDALKQYEKILRLRLQDFLDDIIITEEVGIRKPNPKLYKLALERFHLKPNQAIYVGDNYQRDIIPSRELGIHTVLIHRGGKYDQTALIDKQKLPEYELDNLKDLIPIIKKINLEED